MRKPSANKPDVKFSPMRSGPRSMYTTKTTSKNQSAHKYVHSHAIHIFILSNIFLKKSAIVTVFTLR